MTPNRIRGWLLKAPKPHQVRVTTHEGETQTLAPGRNFARCADTIAAIGPELLEALDKDGNLLRAERIGADEPQRSDAAQIPIGLAADPGALMITHFANLLHRAYEHSTEIAFVKIVELMDKINERSESTEARLERVEAAHRRTVQEQIEDAWERAEEAQEKAGETNGGGFVDQLAASFLGGHMQGAAKPNGKPNVGKTKGSS